MNFFSKRELQDLTSEGIDTIVWLFVGLGIGYALSGGVQNFWARTALTVLAGVGFTHWWMSVLNMLSRWTEDGLPWNRRQVQPRSTEDRLRLEVVELEKRVAELEEALEDDEDDEDDDWENSDIEEWPKRPT